MRNTREIGVNRTGVDEVAHIYYVKGQSVGCGFHWQMVGFDEGNKRIERGTIVTKGGLVNIIAKRKRPFMDQPLHRPDLSDRLSGHT